MAPASHAQLLMSVCNYHHLEASTGKLDVGAVGLSDKKQRNAYLRGDMYCVCLF